MQISCDSGKEEETAGAQECSCATTQPFPSQHPQGRGGAQEAQQELLVCPWLAPSPLLRVAVQRGFCHPDEAQWGPSTALLRSPLMQNIVS